MGDIIYLIPIDKGLISKVYKVLVELSRKNSTLSKNEGDELNRNFQREKNTDIQKAQEKTLHIINHQGDSNQNDEIQSYTTETDTHQEE